MDSPPREVRTYLEMTDPSQLRGADGAPPDVTLTLESSCTPGLWRRLYTEVGRDYHWIDRLGWSDQEVARYLEDPRLELWILRAGGPLAGYFELRKEQDGAVEIAYFGLLPAYVGRGLGRYLLTAAVQRAWSAGASRVWVHTSSLDHPSALPNYLARGFKITESRILEPRTENPELRT